MKLNNLLTDLRGTAQLACDATIGVTGVVEELHGTIMRLPLPLGRMRSQPDAGLAKLIYGSIRGTTRAVDWTIGAALSPFQAETSGAEGSDSRANERDRVVAALNGLLGDHLEASGNPLAQSMRLRVSERVDGSVIEPNEGGADEVPRRWLLLVHGMCMHDGQWTRDGHDHGEELAREHGLTPVYLRYNTGLSVAENGKRLSDQLELFVEEQLNDGDELSILGYSLGGLVTRSAVATAGNEDHRWVAYLDRVVFLGTPHAGAPLAKGGHHFDQALGFSPYSAAFSRLAKSRSAGLRDLRHGLGHELDDWPQDVKAYSVAGVLSTDAGIEGQGTSAADDVGPAAGFLGDGLVSVKSALAQPRGQERDVDPTLAEANDSTAQHHWVAPGVAHMKLLSDRGVYQQLAKFLA